LVVFQSKPRIRSLWRCCTGIKKGVHCLGEPLARRAQFLLAYRLLHTSLECLLSSSHQAPQDRREIPGKHGLKKLLSLLLRCWVVVGGDHLYTAMSMGISKGEVKPGKGPSIGTITTTPIIGCLTPDPFPHYNNKRDSSSTREPAT